MRVIAREVMGRRRPASRGFTLLELGIVVGVIGILSLAVIAGRGYLAASRVNKMVQVIDTTQKGVAVFAGMTGGRIPTVGDLGQELFNRNLVSRMIKTGTPPGVVVKNFRVININRLTALTWNIEIACTDPTDGAADCDSLRAAVAGNEALLSALPAAGANVTFTFDL